MEVKSHGSGYSLDSRITVNGKNARVYITCPRGGVLSFRYDGLDKNGLDEFIAVANSHIIKPIIQEPYIPKKRPL